MKIYRVGGQEVVALPVILESCLYGRKPPSNIISKYRPSDLMRENRKSELCMYIQKRSITLIGSAMKLYNKLKIRHWSSCNFDKTICVNHLMIANSPFPNIFSYISKGSSTCSSRWVRSKSEWKEIVPGQLHHCIGSLLRCHLGDASRIERNSPYTEWVRYW